MAVAGEPSKHWCRKMRSLFRASDPDCKGYITREDLERRAKASQAKFPELAAGAVERADRHWRDHCNCGVEMPCGYRLTESQYIQNLWWKIHQKSFEEELKEAAMNFMRAIDKENKGYFTREEARAVNEKLGRKHPKMEEILNHMDKDNTGRITFEQSLEAQKFFFYDKEDEEHPHNHVYGPLAD